MITDTESRKIASEWHGGGGTALYAFSSTGAINTARADHDIIAEINDCRPDGESISELWKLVGYVYANSSTNPDDDEDITRGPVEGWSKLPW